jgi:hypothetical protein
VIVFTNMIDACGRDADPHEKYIVELREVDLSSQLLHEALECYGPEEPDGLTDCQKRLMYIDALANYGAYAPLGGWAGRNARRLLAGARAESRALEENVAAYEKAMSRPVNRIGSTAREYQAGDIQSAITRGVADGRLEAELMLRLGVGR